MGLSTDLSVLAALVPARTDSSAAQLADFFRDIQTWMPMTTMGMTEPAELKLALIRFRGNDTGKFRNETRSRPRDVIPR